MLGLTLSYMIQIGAVVTVSIKLIQVEEIQSVLKINAG